MSHKEERSDHSYGIIPLQWVEKAWQVLLIQHSRAKFWGFPKGHAEAGESPREAALRELKEETNLEVKRFLSDSVMEEHYQFSHHGRKINKTVWFFVAEVHGQLRVQEEEVSGARWLSLKEAETALTYETERTLLRTAQNLYQS